MSRPLSVALLGFWHVHALEYASEIARRDDARLTWAWDPDPALAEEGLRDLRSAGGDSDVRFDEDLGALLARDIDAVVVTTATAQHYAVILAALRAGKHVFTEKILATTVDQCEELVVTARESRVALLVSLPRLTEPATLAARRLVENGSLGALTYSRMRMAHDGWLAGWLPDRFGDPDDAVGGALTDVGCHPVYLTQLFLGAHPERLTANYTSVTGRKVEDNAVVTASYPNGALAVIEASFVTTPGASTLELRGTAGSLLSGFGTDRLLAKGAAFDPESWQEVPLPPAGPSPIEQWIDHIRAGTTPHENLRCAVDLTAFVAAANAAAGIRSLATH
ncbi:Gfo/Idh/MocA family oxidoreductase [Mycetocola sp. 2940]|uniref:Gfo/Idh/MocA family protein n=1 Tax=Mycetocola sp. 2940 TaxID=3156452 RepID=UPI00339B972F